MDQPVGLRRFQGLRHLQDHSEGGRGWQWTILRDVALQVHAIDKFHRIEVGIALLAEMKNGGYVRVMDQGSTLGLTQETLSGSRAAQRFGSDNFQGDRAVQHRVDCFVSNTHTSFAKPEQRTILAPENAEVSEDFWRFAIRLHFRV